MIQVLIRAAVTGAMRSIGESVYGAVLHMDPGSFTVPNPAPVDPTAGNPGIGLLLAYVKWGALLACAVSAVASGGMMAAGSMSNRPDHVDRGKRALLWSLAGVIVCAAAIPVVNSVFSAATS